MIIGVTGSSGAGKSKVCEILQTLYNSKTITADKIAKDLSKKGTNYLNEIIENFGEDILLEDGELDRKKLAEIIYSSTEKREQLNKCTFKYIKKEIENRIENSTEEIIIIDAPLLFEAKLDKICDVTIAVICENREMQIHRIIERDNITKEHAISRLSAQHTNEFYIKNSQYMLINNDFLEDQIKEIFSKIKNI